MKKNGSTIPGKVFSRPRFFMSTKLGSIVKIGGTMRAVRNKKNTALRPGQRSREKA